MVVFAKRAGALPLGSISTNGHTVVHYFYMALLKVNKLAGRALAVVAIKILAHPEGVQ